MCKPTTLWMLGTLVVAYAACFAVYWLLNYWIDTRYDSEGGLLEEHTARTVIILPSLAAGFLTWGGLYTLLCD